MDFNDEGGGLPSWFGRAAVVGIIVLASLGAMVFLGGSVSHVLSTVGASIPADAFSGRGQPAGGSTGDSTGGSSGTGAGGSNGGEPAAGGTSGGSSGGTSGGSNAGSAGSGDQQLYDPSAPDLQIIKTGSLDLQVATIDGALASASATVESLGGYASGSQRSGDGARATASVTYRIPAARWDDALVALRAVGIKVLGEQAKTEDVTGQIIDLGARITNLQATEQALQAIMAKATKIPDVLEVQSQLSDVRGQIEQLTGQRKHLQEQAAFSTLTVSYGLKAPDAVVTTAKGFDPATEVDHASALFIKILQHLAAAGIWFAIVWVPVLVAIGVLALITILVLRRLTRAGRGGGSAGDLVPTGPAEG